MEAVRWTYNQCLDGIQNHGIRRSKKALRAYCITSESPMAQQNPWCLETPDAVRDHGMKDLLDAYKSNFAKETQFEMKYRTKKEGRDTIVIPCRDYGRQRGHFAFLPKIKSAEPLPNKLEYDSRILMDSLHEFWFCIPTLLVPKKLENQEIPIGKVASIDPGVRTFATIYDSEGKGIEVGKGDIGRIYRLGCVVDQLQSEWDQKETTHKRRYNLKRAAKRIRKKIKNLVKEVHNKLCKYLCTHYEIILLPLFNTKGMVSRRKRRIRSKTARNMISWSHYTFRQKLLEKAREYPWVKIKLVTEEYTSKTCGSCGKLNEKLGSKKRFVCPTCGYRADRDLSAARNILIKSIYESC